MAYKRFYTEWKDEQGWDYTLYILPSNANAPGEATIDPNFTLVELPDDFIMKSMKLETELGEIPVGMVSQTLNMTLNIAALQGTNDYDVLREQLLRGTTWIGVPYDSSGNAFLYVNGVTTIYQRFNTFILMVNDGSGARPIFIGCQKYAAENELTVNKLSEILEYKIECFDIFRCIGETIRHELFVEFMSLGLIGDDNVTSPISIDYGDSFTQNANAKHDAVNIYSDSYADSGSNSVKAKDQAPSTVMFTLSTFEKMQSLFNSMLTSYMRALTWNVNSLMTIPEPFKKAWTFYKPRELYGNSANQVVSKPAYISEMYLLADGYNTSETKLQGGAHYDPTALGKAGNFFEALKLIVENTLETYRIGYSYSIANGSFSATYTADFIRPLSGSGITFNSSNVYGDIKFKLFQETVKSVDVSCTTLQGEKDNKVFPYEEQGTSGDNGKDLEIVFHNLPSASGRSKSATIFGQTEIARKYSINAGMIVWNSANGIYKVDTTCSFKYSNTDEVKLNYLDVPNDVGASMIIEQRTGGIPYTIAYGLVKSLGDAKQTELTFKTKHSICGFEDVGTNCTINMQDLNPLITKIYNANTGTAVITKHTLDVYSGTVDIQARMYA
jgi:hypothetical protein